MILIVISLVTNDVECICLYNPMDLGAWPSTLHWAAKSWTQLKQLSMHAHTGYMYIFFGELSIQINCLFFNLAAFLLIAQLKELFMYSRY